MYVVGIVSSLKRVYQIRQSLVYNARWHATFSRKRIHCLLWLVKHILTIKTPKQSY